MISDLSKCNYLNLFVKQKIMSSIYLGNSQTIDASKHSLNTSGSKQKYTFPKADRFTHRKNKSISDIFYDVPTTRNNRSTSFGYGNKTLGISNDKNKPQPGTYTLPSSFQSNKKGVTFGQGRQKLQLGGPMKQCLAKKFVPGPGKYELSGKTLDVPAITLKGRIEDKSQEHLKKVPGPGTYEYDSMGSSKYYISSKSLYGGGVKIIPGKRLDPLSKSVTGSIGPGSYNFKSTELNPEGKYFLSSFEGSRVRCFSKSKRPDLVNKNQIKNPGPGAYSQFSIFS